MRKIFMLFLPAVVLFACKDQKKNDETAQVKTATTTENKPMQAEFADEKFAAMGKQMLQQFEAGDIDKWIESFADTAVFLWC